MQATFFQFEVVDERHLGVFVGQDVKVVVEGELREDLLLVLGRTFGPLALEDVGEAFANPLELLVRMILRHSSGVSAGAGVTLYPAIGWYGLTLATSSSDVNLGTTIAAAPRLPVVGPLWTRTGPPAQADLECICP